MKRFLLYGHGGAYNHGAEAIIKCTVSWIKRKYTDSYIILSTHFKNQDLEFDMPVDKYCERNMHYVELDKNSTKTGEYDALIYKSTLDQITLDTICVSVGGDNYCYDNWRKWNVIHETALERGAQSILWSCSIDPTMLRDEMVAILKTHHLITARESLTFSSLREKGLKNVLACADIAFLLEAEECELPTNFIVGNTVAINISPLVLRREIKDGIVLQNIKKLVRYILDGTDMNIVLIPHVLMPSDNDLTLLQEIYSQIEDHKRVDLIFEKRTAAEYKYIISKCRFGVFARTHGSIAAYESGIPTVVIGYSVKSQGIAEDLDLAEYVLPVHEFQAEDSLLCIFQQMISKEKLIKLHLSKKMPTYREKAAITLITLENA